MNDNKKYEPTESLEIDGTVYETSLTRKFRNRTPYKAADPRQVKAMIPGLILEIMVKEGQKVKKRDSLLILEAMKMQNVTRAQSDGVIARILVNEGQSVAKNELLLEFE